MKNQVELHVELDVSMADAVAALVDSGRYANQSEVIVHALRLLFSQTQPVEQWLRSEVAAAYDQMQGSPGQLLSSQQVRTHVAQLHRGGAIEPR
ncbi:type II toxin-antitoxin system ParD family antitoxin [Glutamicibacter sp.]|uniref:ribbon-helix-helix domain-containing protein n=1 Tax=Glutamicibacter sp. TaxID=1931995 RepID=UPI0028BEB9F8|nr:type II toxin-antitoxin system ParD family antitoxin [Glutamicibacter sp.]